MASFSRRLIRGLLREVVEARASAYRHWSSPALVFAPHPDDETLGCGGTIAKKLRRGASVHVVFMTDGCRSHDGHMTPAELGALRRSEAVEACRELGLGAEALSFFEIEDGTLAAHAEAAEVRVRELLDRHQPEEVFVPFYADAQPDHVATTHIVKRALARGSRAVRVLEYPVWFWHRWPWVGIRSLSVLRTAFPNEVLIHRELGLAADVRETIAVKRGALKRHRSQMERMGAADWPILSDVSAGDWLRCFFTGRELFHEYVAVPGANVRAGEPAD
jgi:LmbE family N-acetylglucosaminyl deacetylase